MFLNDRAFDEYLFAFQPKIYYFCNMCYMKQKYKIYFIGHKRAISIMAINILQAYHIASAKAIERDIIGGVQCIEDDSGCYFAIRGDLKIEKYLGVKQR